jgi:hypothetical protein
VREVTPLSDTYNETSFAYLFFERLPSRFWSYAATFAARNGHRRSRWTALGRCRSGVIQSSQPKAEPSVPKSPTLDSKGFFP